MSSVGNNKMISGMAGEELLDIEAAILLTGMVNLESLRTPFLNQAAYDRLIDAELNKTPTPSELNKTPTPRTSKFILRPEFSPAKKVLKL